MYLPFRSEVVISSLHYATASIAGALGLPGRMAAFFRNKSKRQRGWLAAFVVCCIFGVLFFPFYKRTIPGRVLRFFILGQGMVRQDVDDFAEDVREKPEWALLQDWSVATLERCRVGRLATNSDAANWSPGTVTLAASEIPGWLSNEVQEGVSPEVSVIVGESGKPKHVAIRWGYYTGLLVGPANYYLAKEDFQEPWYLVEIKQGVYAYGGYK